MEETDINKVLAENLAHYMKKRGVTQAQLAKLSGVGQTTISLYLRPPRRPLIVSSRPSPNPVAKPDAYTL